MISHRSLESLSAISCLVLGMLAAQATAEDLQQLIARAGNAENEQTRYELLRKAASLPELDEHLQRDLDELLPIVDYWANNTYRPPEPRRRAAENGFLCGYFVGKVGPDKYLLPRVDPTSPLYPICCLYRGRMLIHQVIQSGNLRHSQQLRETWCGEGRRLLRVAQLAFPENRIIGMYLDRPIDDWPGEITYDDTAPEWANLQRESLEKLAQVIHWWIDQRQLDNGEFGGGWGDDCEMWRWWSPVMIAFNDPRITAAQERFSQAMYGQPHMQDGYTSHMSDVEHTAEDSKDTITPMLHLRAEDPLWGERARRIAQLMETVWTGTNARGTLQFKGTYFNAREVHPSAERACDTVWHPGVVQPTMLLWLRTRDERLTRLFSRWMDTWVAVTASGERGKPAGIIPSAIHWPEGHAGGLEGPWYLPNIDRQAHLYDWPGNMTMLTSTLLLTYHITGDAKHLEPIHSMAAARRSHLQSPQPSAEPGSKAWCAARLGLMAETLAKYRALTGDAQYDDMLLEEANGYVQFRVNSTRDALVRDLRRQAEALQSNWAGYTSEVRWTDRVISFTSNYLNDYAKPPLPRVDPAFLYATATGDMGRVDYLPLNAVRWLTPPREIAALVTDSGSEAFEAELFHFGSQPRDMAAEFYLLEPGRYDLALTADTREIESRTFDVSGPRTTVSLTLPARQLCVLRVTSRSSHP